MDDDDPEKRIRELERELGDATRKPIEAPPYTGNVTRWGARRDESSSQYQSPYNPQPQPPYTSQYPPTYAPPYAPAYTPPRRGFAFPVFRIAMLVVFFACVGSGMAAALGAFVHRHGPATSTSSGPLTVTHGGSLGLNGKSETSTVECDGGNISLDGFRSKYTVTGHCASIRVGGYDNNVTIENTDSLMSSGYGNTVTDQACNNCDLTLSSYNNTFTVTGHIANLKISSYNNKVTVDSVDTVTVGGYDNRVIYHSGTPKIADSGSTNTIHQG